MIHTRSRLPGPRDTFAPSDVSEVLKMQILQERLTITEIEAIEMMARLKTEAARQLDVPLSTIEIDFEFAGRELDFTITANMQNLPPTRSTRP